MNNTTEIENDEIYDSIYMQVVELVEKDNISCGFYKDTANKLKDLYVITKRSDSTAENKGQQKGDKPEELQEDWISVDDEPPTGTEVLGFNASWVDEDYNPEGTCVCFLCDEGYWTIAKWCGTCDEWHTAYSENWTAHQTGEGHKLRKRRKGEGVNESEMSTRVMPAPTHWKKKPQPPNR